MFAHEQNEPSIVKEAGAIHSLVKEIIFIVNTYMCPIALLNSLNIVMMKPFMSEYVDMLQHIDFFMPMLS